MEQETLAHNKNGYIAICHHCGNYQLSFGTTGMCLMFEEFMVFSKRIFEEYRYIEFREIPNMKSIQIPTFSQDIQVILTYNELLQLRELLEEAIVLVQVYHLLDTREPPFQ